MCLTNNHPKVAVAIKPAAISIAKPAQRKLYFAVPK